MTYKTWERQLKNGIISLPKGERDRIAEYYREMYCEMTACGRSEASVLAEFGSPEKCAKQVLEESGTKKSGKSPKVSYSKGTKEKRKFSAAEVVGVIFFTVLLLIPAAAVGISILISFGAVCVSGAAAGIAGIVFAVYFPFTGVSGAGAAAGIGLGIAASGVGALLFVAFLYVTRGTAILFGKAMKAIYKRR